jgi:DNA repair exonuclease SbcCD ATPase subunit
MAEDIKRVIEVDATSSSKTIRELREEIEKLKKTLSELTAGTKEFAEAQARMSQAQEEVNQAMEISAKNEDAQVKSMQELRAIIDENTGSFGFLVARMQELKAGIDATNARIKQITKDYDEGRMAVDDYNQELQENLEELQKLRTEQGDVRSSLNASTKALLAAKGSYVEMSQTLGQLRNAYRQLSKEQREGAVGTEMLGQIKLLDAELKEVDASMGNFQRNVGGYEEALKQVLPPQAGLIVDLGKLSVEGGGIPSLFTGMKDSIVGMTKAAVAFIATPLGATLTALAAAAAAAFALFNARNKEIEKQAEASAKALEKQKEQMERFDLEISREVELLRADGKEQEANALARRSVTDAMNKAQQAVDEYREKYNQMSAKEQKANAETLKGYEDALQARIDAWEEVIHEDEVRRRTELREEREQNEKLKEEWAKAAAEKQRIAEETNAAIREANAAFRDETALMQAEQGAGTQSGDLALAQEQFRQELAAFETMVDEKQIAEELAMERRKLMLEQYGQEIADIQAKYLKQENDQLLKALDEEMAAEFEADKDLVSQELKNSKERQKIADAEYKHKQMITQHTGALLQAGAQLAGESTAVGKAMAVAAATISTYQAAQAAYQAAFMPVPTYASPVLGAINMAAAIATGLANIKSILSVDSSGGTGYGSSSSTGATVTTPAVVTPPAVVQEVETVRSLTGASEEERLNQMASSQRVYLVYSDVEQAGRRVQVQQSETSF